MSEKRTKSSRKRGPMGGGGPMGGIGTGEKAKDFSGTMKKLIAQLGKQKWQVLIVWAFAIASTVATIYTPSVLGQATDTLYQGVMAMIAGTGGVDFAAIGRILMWLVGLYLLSAALSYVQGFIMSGVTNRMTYQLRQQIEEKIHRLPLSYYDTTTHGEVLSRITNDVDTIGQSLNQSLTQIVTSIASVIGIMVMMLTISWQLTLIALCILPLSAIAVSFIIRASQKYFRQQQEYLGHVNGHIEEMYGSHVVVKAFNGEQESVETFDKQNDTLYNSAWKASFLSGMMMPVTNFVGNIGYVAICIMGGYFAVTGQMTIGGIQAFIQYVRQFTQPISQMANVGNVLQQTAAAAERVFDFLGQPDEVPDTENPVHLDEVQGEIGFEHVSFGYVPEKIIVNDFNALVQPGQKVAIVGPTGAGKTTIVKLLMRFYDVTDGRITMDGHDIRDFTRDELRSHFGMVLQETWLFNGTISDNIRYGKLDASEADVRRAAKAAQVDHFVRTQPDGYDMVLNEDASNVSQGQRQLLTIARAILADPKILILDEATSSVDTRTEIMIQKAMDNLMKGRTSFVIAHRLSTIRDADLILCMNNGDIVEQGTHKELLALNGFYANLYNSQFERAS
ncbi:ABC transporter ATP-binding protein/permease [Eubacteriales bacterium OttesenSCG-928-N13]|nr:ABC transporter ATP-binding protein/permease [Eubacteriales bacterium OttesenSCG-928-N13]